jgi:hypothetical protein
MGIQSIEKWGFGPGNPAVEKARRMWKAVWEKGRCAEQIFEDEGLEVKRPGGRLEV